MNRTNRIILSLISLSLISCATGYGSKGFSGGWTNRKLNERTWEVTFSGNGYTSSDKVYDYFMRRCSEITITNGYDYFSFTEKNESTTTTGATIAGTSSVMGGGALGQSMLGNNGAVVNNISKSSAKGVIYLYKTNERPSTAYSASLILKQQGVDPMELVSKERKEKIAQGKVLELSESLALFNPKLAINSYKKQCTNLNEDSLKRKACFEAGRLSENIGLSPNTYRQFYEKARNGNCQDPQTCNFSALIEYKLENYAISEVYLKKSLQLSSNDTTKGLLGSLYLKNGQQKQATTLMTEACMGNYKKSCLDLASHFYKRSHSKAKQFFEMALLGGYKDWLFLEKSKEMKNLRNLKSFRSTVSKYKNKDKRAAIAKAEYENKRKELAEQRKKKEKEELERKREERRRLISSLKSDCNKPMNPNMKSCYKAFQMHLIDHNPDALRFGKKLCVDNYKDSCSLLSKEKDFRGKVERIISSFEKKCSKTNMGACYKVVQENMRIGLEDEAIDALAVIYDKDENELNKIKSNPKYHHLVDTFSFGHAIAKIKQKRGRGTASKKGYR